MGYNPDMKDHAPAAAGRCCPMSAAQQRLWYAYQLDPTSPLYNVPFASHVSGPLDLDALECSFNEIARRHEALRTTYCDVDGEPMQCVADELAPPLTVVDVTCPPGEDFRDALAAMVSREACLPFDLRTGPLMRVRVCRLSPEEHVLQVVAHHISVDGWSMGIVFRELSALYSSFETGVAPALPALSTQYADYAAWQSEMLRGTYEAEGLAFWRERLRGLEAMDLPADRPRPRTVTHCGAQVASVVDAQTTEAIRRHALGARSTPFTAHLAALQTLIHRYTAADDIATGIAVHGRDPRTQGSPAGLRDMVGFFVNTVVARTDMSGDPTFEELLARVRDDMLGAYEHRSLPFDQVVAAVAPERDPARHPFFNVMLVQHESAWECPRLAGLLTESRGVHTNTSKFDLTLFVLEEASELRLTWEYSTDLFDRSTIERMARHFEVLLIGIAADPDMPLSQLPIMDDDERRLVLTGWNQTRQEHVDKRLHQLVEEQVDRSPDAPAVSLGVAQMTYAELDQKANRLARHLMALGVERGQLVAVAMERSPDLVVGLLGVLKAGAGYLPIDPTLPQGRVAYMLDRARCPVIVTHERTLSGLPSGSTLAVALDCDHACIDVLPATRPDVESSPDDAAYTLFTSGSTGRPKGVVVPHRAIVNHMAWMDRTFPLTPADRVFQKTPIGFDASVWEFWAPLMAGAELVLARPDGHLDPAYMVEAIRGQSITILQMVPSLLALLLDTEAFGQCRSLRRIFCGGEALTQEIVDRLLDALGSSVEVHNLYGPTEAAIDAMWRRCEPRATRASVPIGRPIDNTRIYIVDRRLQPVPIGVVGELLIGGDGLALGYVNQPDLTAERFIPDPFAEDASVRVYRTGDLARYLPDGTVEFIGRNDGQVKLRGVRIELGEVEASLLRHPGVRQAVATIREDVAGEPRLVAYATPTPGRTPTESDLRDHLARILPASMVPSAVAVLDEFPMLGSGKVDRKALPPPSTRAGLPSARGDADLDAAGLAVARIWAAELGLESVGADENFYEVGGHSLLAMRVVSRIRTYLGVDLSLREFLDAGTVRKVAALLAGRAGAAEPCVPVPLPEGAARPVSFAQSRIWFRYRLSPGAPPHVVARTVRLVGPVDVESLSAAIDRLVLRHESLRSTFAERDGAPELRVARSPRHRLQIADLRDLTESGRDDAVSQHACAQATDPMDLENGPLMRIALLRTADDEHLMMIVIHHIVCDGVSLGILIGELAALYSEQCGGPPADLAPVTVQYADYAAWQRSWVDSEAGGAAMEYWTRTLGRLEAVELPTDRGGEFPEIGPADVTTVRLTETVTSGLRRLAGTERATPFMAALAVVQATLGRLTRATDIAVGAPIASRDRPETAGLVGMCLNTLVLRTDLSGEPTFRELLGRVRDVTLGAYAHQDAPFERIVERLHPERQLGRMPFFSVLVNGLGLPELPDRFGDCRLERVRVRPAATAHPITIYVDDGGVDLTIEIVYQSERYGPTRMHRIAEQIALLLDQVVADPDQPVGSYSLVLPEDRPLLPDPTRSLDGPDYEPVAVLVRAEAARDRSAVAVVQACEAWTYGNLVDAVNEIGEALTADGPVRGEMIALTGPRSFGLVASMIAIMDVGAVLVLIDPDLPLHRRRLMLHEARASRLLTIEVEAADRGSDLSDHVPLRVMVSGTTGRPEGTWSSVHPNQCETSAMPADAAYVFFTSGTTGVPKAVLGRHGSLSHFIAWQRRTFETGPHDRCAQLTALSFDPILRDVFLPLTSGGALCLPEERDTRDGVSAMDWLRRQRVTLLHLVPARAQSWLLDAQGADLLPVLRWVFFAGEPLTDALVRAWRTACGGTGVANLYGPTETTLARCWFRVPDSPVPGIQPLGAPIDNSQALVLTDSGAMCGIGEPGQIAIRTPFGTYGYRNAPDEQARRFVPNPHTSDPTDRLYLTGDLGRWRSDGTLAFMGRIDDQVKVRGVRVEPSGVAAALTRHAGVRSSFVVGRTDGAGSTELVAYVVASAPGSATPAMLRAHLRSLLPSAAVPALYVFMDRLPMTPNGKVDRAALPAPEPAPRAGGADPTAPRTPTETVLAELWRDVLGVDRVGVHDGFFDLGGTSLSAARLFARIEARFGKRLPLALIFQAGDIAGLAEALEAQDNAMQWRSLVAIRPAVGLPPFFFVHGVRGNVVGCEALVRHLPAELPVYGLQAASLGAGEMPYASIQDIARSYIEEVVQVCPTGPCFVGGYSFGGLVAYEMACQLAAQGRDVLLLALFDRKAPGFIRLKPLSFRVANHLRTILSLRGEARADYLRARIEGILYRGWCLRLRRAFGSGAGGREPKYEPVTAHSIAVAYYRPEPYAGRTVVFRAAIGLEHHEPEPTHGWRHLVTGPLIAREVPGDHNTMLAEPDVAVLAGELEKCIRGALADTS